MDQTYTKATVSPLLLSESVSMATGAWWAEVQHPFPDVSHVEWLTLTHPPLGFPFVAPSFPSLFSPLVSWLSSQLSGCYCLSLNITSLLYFSKSPFKKLSRILKELISPVSSSSFFFFLITATWRSLQWHLHSVCF